MNVQMLLQVATEDVDGEDGSGADDQIFELLAIKLHCWIIVQIYSNIQNYIILFCDLMESKNDSNNLLLNSGQCKYDIFVLLSYNFRKMELDDDDYHIVEIVDVSLDEGDLQSDILRDLYEHDCNALLDSAHKIMPDKDAVQAFRKEVSKISMEIKDIFYKQIYRKMCQIITEASEDKRSLKQLIDKSFFEFMFILERPPVSLFQTLHEALLSLLRNTQDIKDFSNTVRFVLKANKSIDKKEDLAKDVFSLVHPQKNQGLSNLKVVKNILDPEISAKFEEQIAYIRVLTTEFLTKTQIIQYRTTDDELLEAIKVIEKKAFPRVLEYVLKNQKIHSYCKKIKKQILQFEFKVVDGKMLYVFPELQICEGLKNAETIEKALSYSDDRVLSHMKKDECVVIEGEKVYFKFNQAMLLKIQYALKVEGGNFEPQNLTNLLELIQEIQRNLEKKLATKAEMEEQGKEECLESVFSLLSHFYIRYYMKYERDRGINMAEMAESFSEETINNLLKLCLQWLAKYEGKEFTNNFAEDILSIMAHLFYRNEFQHLVGYGTETSKLLVKILISLKEYPSKWKKLRKIKAIIDRWGDTLSENCENFPIIVRKFFDMYFDQRVDVKSKSKAIFNPMFPSRAYISMFGAETSKKIIDLLENQFKVRTRVNRSTSELSTINEILYKMSFLYTARIKLPDNARVADLLYRLYQNHAHSLPMIYAYRTWIISYSNISKDNASLKTITPVLKTLGKDVDRLSEIILSGSSETLLNSSSTIQDEGLSGILSNIRIFLNSLDLKYVKEEYGAQIYEEIIKTLLKLEDLTQRMWGQLTRDLSQKKDVDVEKKIRSLQLCKKKSLLDEVTEITRNLKSVLRYYICNIAKVIESKDQLEFMKALTYLVRKLAQKENVTNSLLSLINNVLGNERIVLTNVTHFQKIQILKASQRFGDNNPEQCMMTRDAYIPISIVSIIYNEIRDDYACILKNIESSSQNVIAKLEQWSLDALVKSVTSPEEYQKDLQANFNCEKYNLAKFLIMPSINIASPCLFNGKLEQKGREEQALGILWDQFQIIFTDFNSREVSLLKEQIESFLEICRSKDRKVTEKQLGAPRPNQIPPPMQRNQNPRIFEAIQQQLMLMGIPREQVEIALENIDVPDPELALDWIQNNAERMDDLLLNRTMRLSKEDKEGSLGLSMKKSKIPEKGKELLSMGYEEFLKNVFDGIKKLVKLLVPELFGQSGEQIKNLIFICLESFKDEKFKQKSYKNFAEKIFKELDELNKVFNMEKLGIIAGSLELIISKRPSIIIEMHEKATPLKLLSFMEKANQEIGERILSLINQTLPTPDEKCTPLMKEYLHYIGDVLLNSEVKSRSESEILFKMTKSQDEEINRKVLKIVCKGLSKGCLKQGLFSLINIVLNADRDFISANIEFDIKSFLIENHDITKNEDLMEVETKKFAMSFLKYEDSALLTEVCKKIFIKKKKRNVLFYDKSSHDLFSNETLGCSVLAYDPPLTQKIIICSLVSLIKDTEDVDEQIQFLRELYKTLQFYKILIPYCLRIDVQGITFFEWLMEKQFPKGKGNMICFLTFLFVRNGLFMSAEETFSDYLISKMISKFILSKELQDSKWYKLALLYFMQIKNFNKKSHYLLSESQQQSLQTVFETELDISKPIDYILASENLYLIYKYQMIQNLSSLYKISEQGEFTLEKQFVNMDLFYTKKRTSLVADGSASRIRANERIRLFQMLGGDLDEEMLGDEEDMDALMTLRLLRTLSRERNIVPSGMNTIFAPIQPSQVPNSQRQEPVVIESQQIERKVSEEKVVEEKMEEEVSEQKQVKVYLNHIISKFEEILPKVTTSELVNESQLPKFPSSTLKKEDLNENYRVSIKEPRTQLDQKFNKTRIFKDRIKDIFELLNPGSKWEIYQEKDETNENRPQGINPNGGGLRHFVMNRFMVGERERERRQEPRNNEINVSRIIDQLIEYEEPKVEEEKKQKIEQVVEQKMEEKAEEKVEEKPEEKVQQKPEQKGEMNEEKVEENVEEKAEEKEGMSEEKHQKVEERIDEQKSEEVQRPSQENLIEVAQHLEEVRMEEEPLIMPVEENQMVHRQILAMMGLPMTFLHDAGIDEELFDSLPEDMQIEQLNNILQEQRRNNPNPNNNNEGQNQGNQNQNSGNDIQSENVAFIASLDPELRAQTLMEAGPEFLMTLPPEMRAEAENHRQRMIGRIIENEQYEEQQQMYERRPKKNLVYPEVPEALFPSISEQSAKELSKNVLLRIQKFKVEGIKVLLENKKTQKQTISTIISYIKNIRDVTLVNCTYNKQTKQWMKDEMTPDGAIRKLFIEELLDLVNDHLVNCPYKDDKFLTEKYSYHNYFGKEIAINPDLLADAEGYYPLYELLQLCIDNSHDGLATELIKKAKSLPDLLCRKIVRAMRDDKLREDFYRNMEGLSESEDLRKHFFDEFPEKKPPKFSVLTMLLKYKFARLPYLKTLHVQALACYKSKPAELNDFLNEIFRTYDVDDIQEIEPILAENKQTHFQIIKHLYSKGKFLDGEPIGIILKLPHLLDFETKRFIFQNNPKLVNRGRSRFIIEVNRTNLFHQSYNQLMGKTARELEGRTKVVFVDEPAEDAGGVKKEWFLCVSREIFDARYALFEPSSSGNTYHPNPKSYVNAEHLNYFKFIGRFVAKALTQGMLIDAFFTRSFYKMILGQDLELKDLEQQDYNFYTSMCWLRENKLEGNEYTFSYLYDYFGKMTTKELIPDGEKIFVTEENKQDYIERYSLAIMREAIAPQVQKFLEGFYEILPKEYISFFEAKELELLMSGMPTINLADLKENIEYVGYQPTDPQIQWFWEILGEYSNEDLARLIQFITGTSKIPLEGFVALQGMNGLQKISIHKDSHTNQLPKSHTCFNQLDLPNYPTKQIMKEKFRVVLTWGSEGFGFM